MPQNGIQISRDIASSVRRAIPVLTQTPVTAATDFVTQAVSRMSPDVEHRELGGDNGIVSVLGDRTVAYSNPSTGQASMVPLLDALPAQRTLRPGARSGVRALLDEHQHLFTDDLSRVRARQPVNLMQRTHATDGSASDASAVLSTVKLERTIGSMRVCGPGAASSFSFAANGLQGFTNGFRRLDAEVDRLQVNRPAIIRDRIVEHLGDLPDNHAVDVRDATLVYYDDGGGTLQPAYRYRVVLESEQDDPPTAPGMLVGYVPAGDLVGTLPSLRPTITKFPADALLQALHPYEGTSVGRYVVREDNAGWVASANAFWDSLNTGANFPFFTSPVKVRDAQYYWAEPRLFLNEKDSFINSVHLALTEVHGNWNLFSTYKNYGDLVNLKDVPSPGYGGWAGGSLAYWIIHSCEVIPTATDTTTSFDVWWNIFNGLRAAMGYRTEMWINDQVSSQFGFLVGLGASVVSSWLTTVFTDNDYQKGDTYYDSNVNMNQPMGRPSAIAVTGHGDDNASMVTPLAKPTSLTEWWYDN